MNRDRMINTVNQNSKIYDFIVIGGGATGLGVAIEAATRGFSTILLEQADFTKGTSSRSTKLVHGGVRYLAQGHISLVFEALKERGLLKNNAPHLVTNQPFIIPSYKWWVKPFYAIGLTIYDLMSLKLSLGRSKIYSKEKTLKYIPTLKLEKLRGGVVYYDGQFDDARLGINLCQTFVEKGGVAINYAKVTNLIKENNTIKGVVFTDLETGKEIKIKAKGVVNATGVFIDNIIKMDTPSAKNIICASQGVHLVIAKKFIPNQHAIMIPKTADGRVLFAVPWHNKVILGTTDVVKEKVALEPKALNQEIDFILETAGRYLAIKPKQSDIKSVFAGLRPLVSPKESCQNTKEITRGYKIIVSNSKLLTITGGKWTTYRKMGEVTINKMCKLLHLKQNKSITQHLKIHGYQNHINFSNPLHFYGSDLKKLQQLAKDENLEAYLSKSLHIIKAQVIWGVRFEMARTVEDILARRTRALFLDAKESVRIAPEVAQLMAKELNKDKLWRENQIIEYEKLAENYILN